jgi:uncharacterized protein YxeA
MKKIFITLLVIINIFVLIGLAGLVFYQFKQILDRNNQIDGLSNQIVQLKNTKSTTKTSQLSATTQSSLQIKDEGQSTLFDGLIKNTDNLAKVKIFFLKKSENTIPPNTAIASERLTDRKDILNFSIEELIKGPSSAEQTQNIYTPIKLTGSSNCGTGDFSLVLNGEKVTIKFCKAVTNATISDSDNLKEAVDLTLKQFTGVQKITILNNNNTCYGETTGQDLCKNI